MQASGVRKGLALIWTLYHESYEAELYQICKGKGMHYQKDQITSSQRFSLLQKHFGLPQPGE
jgi:hypothetical protein